MSNEGALLNHADRLADTDTTWHAHAVCRGKAAVLEDPAREDEARALCRTCPVLTDCRIWVLSLPVRDRPDGVYAGQTNAERDGKTPREAPAKPARKQCSACKKRKPLEEFDLSSRAADGHSYRCIPCRRDAVNRSHERNRNRQKEMSST